VDEPEPDEASLAARAARGDAAAFKALLARVEPAVRARVERRLPAALRRKVSVDDVLQEARLVAFRRLSEFEDRGPGSFAAWLVRIAELKLREAVRRWLGTAKRGREVSRGARPATDAFAARGPSPSEVAVASELKARATKAMDALSDDHRRVLELVQVEGLPLAEAAARMGRSADAARKLYGRALARFAEALDVEEGRRDGG
jgi:RNA polymerase sigma-70 factor (ECF subfamily)